MDETRMKHGPKEVEKAGIAGKTRLLAGGHWDKLDQKEETCLKMLLSCYISQIFRDAYVWTGSCTLLFNLQRIRYMAAVMFVAMAFFCWHAGDASASHSELGFSVYPLDSGQPGKTALIVGGIQGDEPGGFNAAALIATRYTILSGQVIVVPNLNFESIIKRSRGVHGDMNRKFDHVSQADPERQIIAKIKAMITDPKVDFILNLHDGSGFFTPKRITKMRNPDRWGQSIIIDQAAMPGNAGGLFHDLAGAATMCAADVNRYLLDSSHQVHVKNTHTAQGDVEMAKTLTFFAMKNNKPAFGIEASKAFLTPGRVYYHLLAIESFLTRAGILFERDFPLSLDQIDKAIDKDIALTLGEERILLLAENIRNRINYLPMEKNSELKILVNNPLLALVHNKSGYSLYHGNRCLSRLNPQYFEYDMGLDHIAMVIDGERRMVPFGSRVTVKEEFMVCPIPEHRVNIIGFSKPHVNNESGVVVSRKDFMERFSLDRDGRIYRVEVYSQGKFNGMVLADFRLDHNAGQTACVVGKTSNCAEKQTAFR